MVYTTTAARAYYTSPCAPPLRRTADATTASTSVHVYYRYRGSAAAITPYRGYRDRCHYRYRRRYRCFWSYYRRDGGCGVVRVWTGAVGV